MYKLIIKDHTLIRCALQNRIGQNSYDEIAVVPDDVEEIGDRAFYQCAFGGIILPNGLKAIGDYAFDRATSQKNKNRCNGCEYVGSVENPYMVLIDVDEVDDTAISVHPDTRFIDSTAYKKERWWYKKAKRLVLGNKLEFIGKYAFWGATFAHVEIPESVVCIREGAFCENYELEAVALPSGLEAVADLLFYRCKGLKSVVLPEKLVSIGAQAFEKCSALTEVTVPNSTREIGVKAFFGCSALKKAVLGDSIVKIGADAFRNCTELEEVVMPAALDEIPQGSFFKCEKLKSVKIPDGVKRIGQNAFSYCASLEVMHIPAGVAAIDGSFDHCDALKRVTVDPLNAHYFMRGNSLIEKATDRPVWIGDRGVAENVYVAGAGKSEIGFEEYRNNTYLKSVRVAPTVKAIQSGAFRGCSSLEHIELPDGLKELGHDVFGDCSSLREIVVPASVTEFGFDLFGGCTALKSAVFEGAIDGCPSFKNCVSLTSVVAPSVRYTGYKCFENCAALEEIELPAMLQEINKGTFSGCTSLKRIVIPSHVEYVGDTAFLGCSALEEVVIESTNILLGSRVFDGCTALRSLTIGKGVRLGIAALVGCDGLMRITVSPDNELYYVRDDCLFTKDDTLIWMPAGRESFPSGIKGIGGGMFGGSSLERFTVPDGVERIVDEAFAQSKLKEVSFPASLKTVDLDAFDQCFDMRMIYFRGTRYEFNGIDFGESDYDPSNEDEDYFNLVKGLDYTGQIDVVCTDDE